MTTKAAGSRSAIQPVAPPPFGPAARSTITPWRLG
jgi:hypothetical protein